MRNVTIIIPSVGRDTLAAAVESVYYQVLDTDRIIVVFDRSKISDLTVGDCARLRLDLVDDWVFVDPHPAYGRGGAQRLAGIRMAETTHIAFLDDDDVFTPDALAAIRAHAHPYFPTVFRMDHHTLGTIWQEQKLCYGNVGMPQIVVPNDPDKMGSWEPWTGTEGCDFTFFAGCVNGMGGVEWRHEVVCKTRPHERTSVPKGKLVAHG